MTLREMAREALPPFMFRLAGQITRLSLRFEAVAPDWDAAKGQSSGYDEAEILARVTAATRAVVSGHACYERDSVTFHEPDPPWQLLAPLMRHALRYPGPLNVVDFGGSLGSAYRHCRPYLPEGLQLNWTVIEQPNFVQAGRREFTTNELSFTESLADLPTSPEPRFLLASGVLQYLQKPDQIVAQWTASGARTLVIDRTPVSAAPQDVLAIQRVPRHIYRASYPCWVLSRSRLLTSVAADWQLLAEFNCAEGRRRLIGGGPFEFRGFVFERDAPGSSRYSNEG